VFEAVSFIVISSPKSCKYPSFFYPSLSRIPNEICDVKIMKFLRYIWDLHYILLDNLKLKLYTSAIPALTFWVSGTRRRGVSKQSAAAWYIELSSENDALKWVSREYKLLLSALTHQRNVTRNCEREERERAIEKPTTVDKSFLYSHQYWVVQK
jgi:hypothetical protein